MSVDLFMRRILFRGLIAVAFLVVVLVVWIVAGRQISMLVDRAKTVFMKSLPVTPLTHDGSESGGTLQIGELPMSIEGPDYTPVGIRITNDAQQRIVLSKDGKSFLLAQEPGDDTSFTIERSMMSWPTPFDFNFMTGVSPSWRRHLYYVLRWKKSSGARLKMVWRYEQYFYSQGGWTSGFMTRAGSTGLIQVEVSE